MNLDDLERRLDGLTARNIVPLKVKESAPPEPAPRGWRFVPHRDDDNLIVEIIATPIK